MSLLLNIALRCTVVYCFVLLLLRIGGKRQIGQMTPVDLVMLLLISNAVQNAMTGPDTTILGGIMAAGCLFLLNGLMGRLMRHSRFFRKWLEGTPTILINHGEVMLSKLDRENIDHEELMQALRNHGVSRPEDVRLAVLERDGSISVIKNEDLPTGHVDKPYHRIRSLKRHL